MVRRMVLGLAAVVVLLALPLRVAAQDVAELTTALQLERLSGILHLEGLDYGKTLEAEMFPGQGGRRWTEDIARIHAPERLAAGLQAGLAVHFDGRSEDLGAAVAFFTSELGRRVIELELAAREALLDEAIKESAEEHFEDIRVKGGDRLEALDRFVTVNDLIETNVVGAMNSNLAFMQGMADGGALEGELSESEMLADIWTQEEQIREDMVNWVYPYLVLAYQPLSDEDLAAYTAFCETQAGRAVNAALFAAFDQVFSAVSYDLGRAVAGVLSAQDI